MPAVQDTVAVTSQDGRNTNMTVPNYPLGKSLFTTDGGKLNARAAAIVQTKPMQSRIGNKIQIAPNLNETWALS